MSHESWTAQKLRSESCFWRARILGTAYHLGLFDWLGKSAKSARGASIRFGGTPEGWDIFLTGLAAMGLLRRRGERYENSFFSLRHLCSDKGAFLLADHEAWAAWGRLPRVLTTGRRPKFAEPFLTDRKSAARLLQALDYDGLQIAPYLLKRLPLGRSRTLLDVGGGLGTFAVACCRRFPALSATVVEHPNIATLARRAVKKAQMADRVRVIGVDILSDPLPGGFDAVLLSNVLHGHGATENRALIAALYRSLNPQGRLILRDVLMSPDRTTPQWGALFSVALLLHTPEGRCYSLDEVRRWLRKAGFAKIEGPFRSSPLYFDPDSVVIAQKGQM